MPTILVVDDDLTSQEILTDILNFAGLDVETASSGEDALQYVENTSYDGIIIDLHLPGINGWQLFESLQSVTNASCIAITVYDSVEVQQEIRRVGFAGYFVKPVDELSFGQSIVEICG